MGREDSRRGMPGKQAGTCHDQASDNPVRSIPLAQEEIQGPCAVA